MDKELMTVQTLPPQRQSSSKRKSSNPFKVQNKSTNQKRKRTKEDFLHFCQFVLNYTQFEPEEKKDVERVSVNSAASLGSNSDSALDSPPTYNETGKPNSSSSEDEGTITCFCRKPYSGRPMIECDACETWVHLSCAKIRHTHIPKVYFCPTCRDEPNAARKSGRVRTQNKRFKNM